MNVSLTLELALRRDVRAGFDAVERGEFTEYDEADIGDLANRVKARGQKCLVSEDINTGTS